jgi:hypothetical protein
MEPLTFEERRLLQKILERLNSVKKLNFTGTPWDCASAGPLLDRMIDAFTLLLAKP